MSVYSNTPAIISLFVLGLAALVMGMTFVTAGSTVTQKGFAKMAKSVLPGKTDESSQEKDEKEGE